MRRILFILGQLDDRDVEWLATTGQKIRLTAGETLVEAGRPIENLYILLDGRLLVTDMASGEQLAELRAGEVVGEISFVDSLPPTTTVTAMHDSLLLQVEGRRLKTRLADDAEFAARFYRAIAIFLASRLRGMVTRLGYGGDETLDEMAVYKEELDENTLDTVSLAGERFDRMLKQLMRA